MLGDIPMRTENTAHSDINFVLGGDVKLELKLAHFTHNAVAID